MGVNCTICGADSVEEIGTTEGYRQTSAYMISECAACGTSAASPRESDTRIYEAIYRNIERVPGYSRYHSLASAIRAQGDPLTYLADAAEPYFAVTEVLRTDFARQDRPAICEVGCGQGYFTFALRQAGFSATGVDHSREAIESARKRYGDFYFCGNLTDYVAKLRERPQFIFACEVIEHLVDPAGFVAEALECLPSGGILAVTTPNKLQDGDQSANVPRWDTELPPVHLWWLTKRGFVGMARRLNCPVSFCDFTEFYRRNERLLVLAKASCGQPAVRTPVLDRDYNLIQYAPPGGRLEPLKNTLKGLMPGAVIRELRRLRASRGGSVLYRDDQTSTTIGAVFRKR